MDPRVRTARPPMISSRVLLPTPLRPTTATTSPDATVSEKSSTTVVGPQPPVRWSTASMRALPFGADPAAAEIHGLHVGRRQDIVGRSSGDDVALDQNRYLG